MYTSVHYDLFNRNGALISPETTAADMNAIEAQSDEREAVKMRAALDRTFLGTFKSLESDVRNAIILALEKIR